MAKHRSQRDDDEVDVLEDTQDESTSTPLVPNRANMKTYKVSFDGGKGSKKKGTDTIVAPTAAHAKALAARKHGTTDIEVKEEKRK